MAKNIHAYQAIVTKYIGPTDTKGSRIKAIASAGSVTIEIDHALNIAENHAAAAESLANKYKWRGIWHMGGLPNDSGYCFVASYFGRAIDNEPAFTTQGE